MVDLPRDGTTHSELCPYTSIINNNNKMAHGCTRRPVLATSRPWVLSLVPKKKNPQRNTHHRSKEKRGTEERTKEEKEDWKVDWFKPRRERALPTPHMLNQSWAVSIHPRNFSFMSQSKPLLVPKT